MKDFSEFSKFSTQREGYDFTPPYGFYMVPISTEKALSCYLSSGESVDEEGWEHLAVSIQNLPNSHNNRLYRSQACCWKKRPPTVAEINIARLTFFKREEWVVNYLPPLSLLDPSGKNTGSELIVHLWSHRNGFPSIAIPPPILLEGFRANSKSY